MGRTARAGKAGDAAGSAKFGPPDAGFFVRCETFKGLRWLKRLLPSSCWNAGNLVEVYIMLPNNSG